MRSWPVKKYSVRWNPKTAKGGILLELTGDNRPDVLLESTSAEEVQLCYTILETGRAMYSEDGSIYLP
jgi:hypothetical protein